MKYLRFKSKCNTVYFGTINEKFEGKDFIFLSQIKSGKPAVEPETPRLK